MEGFLIDIKNCHHIETRRFRDDEVAAIFTFNVEAVHLQEARKFRGDEVPLIEPLLVRRSAPETKHKLAPPSPRLWAALVRLGKKAGKK